MKNIKIKKEEVKESTGTGMSYWLLNEQLKGVNSKKRKYEKGR